MCPPISNECHAQLSPSLPLTRRHDHLSYSQAVNPSSPTPADSRQNHVIIAFDSDCLLCSSTIRWLAARDHHDRLRFTPLKSPAGQQLVSQIDGPIPDSILVEDEQGVHTKSTATITIFKNLSRGWSCLAKIIQCLTPRCFRDLIYDWIARSRHRWAKPRTACELPNEALKRRMIHHLR